MAAFAAAIDAAPAAGVPPTYAAVYALQTTVPRLFADREAAVDLGRLVHAEQHFEWARHPEVGDTLIATGTVIEDRERRGMRFLTFETECLDGSGGLVCRSRMLAVIRP